MGWLALTIGIIGLVNAYHKKLALFVCCMAVSAGMVIAHLFLGL
jgi:hypothetical protein